MSKVRSSCLEIFYIQFAMSKHSVWNLNQQSNILGSAAIAQWIRLHLLQPRVWMPSTTYMLRLFNINLNCNVKRTKINKKQAGIGPLKETIQYPGFVSSNLKHQFLQHCFDRPNWLKYWKSQLEIPKIL